MGAQHTPGPWKFGHLGTEALWVGPEYDALQVAQVPHDTDEARDESRANARLIAAAPEEHEALFKLVNEVCALRAFEDEIRDAIGNTNWTVLFERVTQAEAAIAKATGQ